jgi:hypothetical protein
MSRRQLGWVVAIGVPLLFVLVTGKYAYDCNALGASTSGAVAAVVWAVSVLVAVGNLVGLLGVVKESSTSLVIQLVNSLAGRLAIIALSVALGAVFLVAALRVEPPRAWDCRIQGRRVAAPDRSRCPDGEFAQMRSFSLRLLHLGDLRDAPTLRARVTDRAASSVALDSDRGGLCIATGPDQPTRGESRLALSADCGVDGEYAINLHVCDVHAVGDAGNPAAELRAAAGLEMQEGSTARAIDCD